MSRKGEKEEERTEQEETKRRKKRGKRRRRKGQWWMKRKEQKGRKLRGRKERKTKEKEFNLRSRLVLFLKAPTLLDSSILIWLLLTVGHPHIRVLRSLSFSKIL